VSRGQEGEAKEAGRPCYSNRLGRTGDDSTVVEPPSPFFPVSPASRRPAPGP
jgi:hypothetical protein